MLVALDAILAPGAPLLEEEGGVGSVGLGEEAEGPFFLHGTGVRTTFATYDDPMDASEVEGAEVFEEGFAGEETDGGGDIAEAVDARLIGRGFDSYPQPYIFGHRARGEVFLHALCSFCKYLKSMLRCGADGLHDAIDEFEGHIGVEDVAHGAYEDRAALLPSLGCVKVFGVQGQLKAVLILGLTHCMKSASHDFGIAMGTSAGCLGATRDGVPRLFGPFYFCGSHSA